ncbi:MAG: hypothetical protein JWO18_138, partial [Microbacteriaceae bacterium]|nr:hypothetical protein [Microbacteriaceae bacterium]
RLNSPARSGCFSNHSPTYQHIGQGCGFIIGQGDRVDARVRIVDAEQRELALTRPIGDDTDSASRLGNHVMPGAQARQIDFLDSYAHAATLTA